MRLIVWGANVKEKLRAPICLGTYEQGVWLILTTAKKLMLLLLMMIAFFNTSAVYADWRNTSWGMPLDKAMAGLEGTITNIQIKNMDGYMELDNGKTVKIVSDMIEARYQDRDIKYNIYLTFDDNKLVSVNMHPIDQEKCPLIAETLANDMTGLPVKECGNKYYQSMKWADAKNNNELYFYYANHSNCFLTYSRFKRDF